MISGIFFTSNMAGLVLILSLSGNVENYLKFINCLSFKTHA